MTKNKVLYKMSKIEDLEIKLTLFNSKRALADVDKALELLEIGSSKLMIERNSPKSGYYNRIKGFGEHDIGHLETILSTYSNHGIDPFFEMTPNNINESVSKALNEEGFINIEQLVYMENEDLKTTTISADIEIVEVTEENAEDFIELIRLSNQGMTLGEDVIERKKHYFYEPNFHNYIAYIGEEVAGMGSLFISENEGYIANGYTFEKLRGFGCQKALLAHRVNEAVKFGIHVLYTDVAFGSISHNNMKKLGFSDVYTSSFWAR